MLRSVSLLALAVFSGLNLSGQQNASAKTTTNYGNLPLSFEENMGQMEPNVKFFTHGQGTMVYFTDKEAVLNLIAEMPKEAGAIGKGDIIKLSLVGAEPKRVLGEGLLPGKINYLQTASGHPIREIPTFSAVKYEAAYPGIDALYHGAQHRLEYDFQVTPAVDPKNIRLKIEGAQGLRLLPTGELEIAGKYGSIRWNKPVAYQEYLSRGRVDVAVRYAVNGNIVSFEVGPYDRKGLLIIDPTLVYSTYIGGNDQTTCCDGVHDVAVDGQGFAYIAGVTVQSDFPLTAGAYDSTRKSDTFPQAFVSKLNQDGSALVYSTYLTGDANATGVAVDQLGDAYVTGVAENFEAASGVVYKFQTTPGAFRSMDDSKGTCCGAAFVLKLSPDGSQAIYSTVIGSLQGGITSKIAISSGSTNPQAYITGFVAGNPDFPVTTGAFQTTPNNAYDAFVTCVNGDGSDLCYSTYLGGDSDQAKFSNLTGNSFGNAIVVRPTGDAIVTGYTRSDNFPATNTNYAQIYSTGNADIFVTELNASGSGLIYSTIIGGPYDDFANALTLDGPDGSGIVYVAGGTNGGDFPTLSNSYSKFSNNTHDGVIFALSPDGQMLVASTFLGGSDIDDINGIGFDGQNVHVAGTTKSRDFPVTPDAFQNAFVGNTQNSTNAFYSKLNGGLSSLEYSTYFGASGSLNAQGSGNTGNALAIDSRGNVYLTGNSASGLPTSSNAFQINNSTRFAIPYVAKFSGGGTTDCSTIDLTVTSPTDGFSGPSPINFQANASSGCQITALQIYQDNTLVYQTANSNLVTNLSMPAGQHFVVVQAWNTAGTIAKVGRNITVTTSTGGGGTCQASAQSVNLCLPVRNSTVASPVEVSAGSNIADRTLLRLYLDNQVLFETGAAAFDQSFAMSSGLHHLVLVGYGNSGVAFSSDAYFTVSGGSQGCPLPSADATISVCAPAQNATVSSPFQLDARARWDGFTITHMRVYVDNQPAYDQDTPPNGEITPTIQATAGQHSIVVVAWNGSGQAIASSQVNITVQ